MEPKDIVVKDITPAQPVLRQLTVPKEKVADFLAVIDPAGPTGKGAQSFTGKIGPQGELEITIGYRP
jgi:hypothetical protein